MRLIFGLILSSLAVSACSDAEGDAGSSADTESASTAVVSADYRKSFDRAWERAGEGRSPTTACAGVVGKAVGRLKTTATDGESRAEALKALDACYVRAMARFVETTLSVDSPGTQECISLIKALSIHRRSLGGFIEDVGEDRPAYDRRLNDLIGDKVRSACPDASSTILGT